MSHNVTVRKNGKAEIAYVGEIPWHGLGQELPEGAPIDTWLVAAGMDWRIQRAKVRYPTSADGAAKQQFSTIDDKHVLFRSDTGESLAIVSDKFKVVQPKQVLEFFRDLCATNRFTMETAGTLRGGAVYWALAKIGEEADVGVGDRMRGYVLLSTACDGTRKTSGKNCATRVVCNNTLDAADREGTREVTISHRSVFDEAAMKRDLGLARSAFDQFMVNARALAGRKLAPSDFDDMVLRLLGGDDVAEFDKAKREAFLESRHAMALRALYSGAGRGSSLATAKGTAWGFVNAVTEYVDHKFPARSDDNRLYSAWFGNGERLKNDALRQALALVTI